MPNQRSEDLDFLTEAMSHLTGSLDIRKSLVNTFDFLAKHFPIDAISLHQYSSINQTLNLLFLVRAGEFHFVEKVLPLTKEEANPIAFHDLGMNLISNLPSIAAMPLKKTLNKTMSTLLSSKDRGVMTGILQSGEDTIGHLSLLGTHPECFNSEHERKLALILTPFALTMANLLRFKRVLDFQERLQEENQKLQKGLEQLREKRIIGDLAGLRKTMDVVYQLDGREVPTLILGETGTGKELIADTIHNISPRKDRPFIKVNCGAIPDTLVDSELFGYEKGAFTGATAARPGRFEQADGGTLFLDEVGELPPQVQVRLLRVLQNNVIERIGGTKSIHVNVRVIAATNRNLESMIREGSFREDLYYRLNVFPITVPPLRERKQDIPELINYFLKQTCKEHGIGRLPLIPFETAQQLQRYKWPGNVRELENLVKRGVTLTPNGPLRLEELLPQNAAWYTKVKDSPSDETDFQARVEAILNSRLAQLGISAEPPSLHTETEVMTMDTAVRNAITTALKAAGCKIHGPGGAADLLDINPSTLRGKMRKLGIKLTGCD